MGGFTVIAICTFVAFGGFLFGYDTGLISGIIEMETFINDFGYTDANGKKVLADTQLIVSMLSVGTVIGAIIAGLIADKYGRKISIILSSVVFAAGVLIQTFASQIGVLIFGRVVAGLGVGLLSDLVPLYQAEAAPKNLRGTLVSSYQLAITIGLVGAFVTNYLTKDLGDSWSYRIPIVIQMAFAGILGFGMMVLPESPRVLLAKGDKAGALKALCTLWGTKPDDHRIIEEMEEIEQAIETEKSYGHVGYADLLKGSITRRTFLSIAIQMFQQLTGINFIFYYGPTFFKSAKISNAFLIQIITGVTNVLATIPGLYLVERIGRRALLLTGSAMMFVGMVLVGIIGTAFEATVSTGISMVIFTCVFIAGFAYSWGPAAWVISSEIFPTRVRGKGVSVATTSNWIWNFILAFATPYFVQENEPSLHWGPKVAFLWAAFILAGFVFIYFSLPETSGLSLEDIDELFESGVPAYRSAQWTPSGMSRQGGHIDVDKK